nr:hypothetical protein [Deinobacterium chartae]
MLREYQDYVLAYRLRHALGGRVAPPGLQLDLQQYAARRVRRQLLAHALVRKEIPLAGLDELDRLTLETAYGFWHNPVEVTGFLRAALRQGGHPALSRPEAFLELLSAAERERLGEARSRVSAYYQACLWLGVPGLDPDALEHAHARLEAQTLPIFIDELQDCGFSG